MTVALPSAAEAEVSPHRDNSIKGERPELDASLFAEDWKSVVAVPQTLLERLQVLARLGSLSMVNEALDAISRRITNRALSGVVKVGAMNLAETGTEELQHLMPYVAQDLAHAFAGDTRTAPAQWYNGKDGAFDGFWNRQATTFISMFPLAAFTGGHGGNREARNHAFTEATPLQRRAFGITEEHSAAIDAAGDLSSRDAAINTALTQRDPSNAVAQAATEELETQLTKQQDIIRQAQETGTAPRIIRTSDGTHAVLDGKTGEEIGTASDLAGATRLATTHMEVNGEGAWLLRPKVPGPFL